MDCPVVRFSSFRMLVVSQYYGGRGRNFVHVGSSMCLQADRSRFLKLMKLRVKHYRVEMSYVFGVFDSAQSLLTRKTR